MDHALIGVVVGTLLASATITAWVRRLALAHSVLDVPNNRSSHSTPVPRGGGAAMAIAASCGWLTLWLCGWLPRKLLIALLIGGAAVALVGFVDDRWNLGARMRMAVHVAAAVWALAWIGGVCCLRLGGLTIEFGWLGYVLGGLGIVWALNLFNFMDGIDGIAASEIIFICCAAALLGWIGGGSDAVDAAALTLGAAACGFLIWNWPPAKIFMGDVGSGYIGYQAALMALAAARHSPTAILVWSILSGVFIVDATVTLIVRLLRGERVYQAHRTHAYQWLVRRWGSHRRVTVMVSLVNLLWLFPCALLATLFPGDAGWLTLLALLPLVLAAFAAGSGRAEILGG
jgi:Fuc2NAc and GlcNAc transferase